MKKFLFLNVLILMFSAVQTINAQDRKSVSAAEVNGTYRSYLGGKAGGDYNEIKILSVGKGKLQIAILATYPYKTPQGELMANTGAAEGAAAIDGDTAVYSSDAFGQCSITIKFVKPGTIKVTQQGSDTDCGFGHNVSADGTYKKSSGAKPKF